MLLPTVSRPVCLGIKHTSGAYDQIFISQIVAGLLMWGAFSDERTGPLFTVATGPRQRSHSRVRVPWDSRPYFTFSDSRLPFPSPPTTRRGPWRYSTPPPHGIHSTQLNCLLITSRHEPHRNTFPRVLLLRNTTAARTV
jgi:hypothetical protein